MRASDWPTQARGALRQGGGGHERARGAQAGGRHGRRLLALLLTCCILCGLASADSARIQLKLAAAAAAVQRPVRCCFNFDLMRMDAFVTSIRVLALSCLLQTQVLAFGLAEFS